MSNMNGKLFYDYYNSLQLWIKFSHHSIDFHDGTLYLIKLRDPTQIVHSVRKNKKFPLGRNT